MAKGQVTEKDLELGLKKAGGFSGLSKTRRDSPFGQEHAKPVKVSEPAIKKSEQVSQKVIDVARSKEAKKQLDKTPVQKKPTRTKSVQSDISRSAFDTKNLVATKAETFSERITLNITPDMRDKAEMLARGLQRRKADRTERITANTIYRVAIEALLSDEDFLKSISPNTEQELLEAVKAKK